ncbi:MAG: META domain-containing protein [Campylobacteraceae bacterium]|nr:META domain-containing protein [Campylobacteraceae bacterium]
MRFFQLFLVVGVLFLSGCSLLKPETVDSSLTLENCYFKLVTIGSEKVQVYDNQGEPHLILGNKGNVYGSDGCNRLMGSYKIDKDKVEFSQMASTMMACQDGMDQAAKFMQNLNKVERYSISGENLSFSNRDGEVILSFKAVVF